MRKQRVLQPVQWARAVLVGLVASGVLTTTLVHAQTWSGPSATAPSNNTPDLIWNSAAPGFSGSQNASFSISGSGTLAGSLRAALVASGGYAPDATNAVTTPTLWAGAARGTTANFTGSITAPQYCIGASCITAWPTGGTGGGLDLATADARYINVTGDSMTGNLTMNAGTVFSAPQICLAGDCRTVWPSGAGSGLDIGTGDARYVNITGDTMSGQLTVNTPGIGPSINTSGVSGVQGVGSTSWGVRGVSNSNFGVLGESTSAEGVRGQGANAGGYFQDTNQSTAAYVAYGTYGFYTTSASNQMGGLTVTGDTTTNRLCLGGVCNSSWPAGGGGLDIPTADGRYVNITGDSMTGGLNINASSASAVLYADNASGMAVYGTGVSQGARFRDSDQGTYTDIASGVYGIYTGATSNYLGGLTIPVGGTISLGGVTRSTWPSVSDYTGAFVDVVGDTMTGLLTANGGIRMGGVTRAIWPTQAITQNGPIVAPATGWQTVSCPVSGAQSYVTGFVCTDTTGGTGCRSQYSSATAVQYYSVSGRTYSYALYCLTGIN